MRVILENELTPKTHATVLYLAQEFAIDPNDGAGLAWLIEIMKQLPEKRFPLGKFHTIRSCQRAVGAAASRAVMLVTGVNHDGR